MTTNNIVWFTATYWAYLETRSVLATSIMAGVYLVCVAISGFWFGSIVDHNKKKHAMLISSCCTLLLFAVGLSIYATAPQGAFATVGSASFWIFLMILLFGVIAGNIRMISLATATSILVPEDGRDKMNGLSGTIMGISFMISSVISGFALSFAGMFWVLSAGIVLTAVAIIHLFFLSIPEKDIVHAKDGSQKIDLKGTILAVRGIPGLFGLIFFTTFNNFLGGVFMPLMDAYGLSLVPLYVWGTLWGFLSVGFIVGGIYIAKKGLGKNPLRTLFTVNIILWTVSIFMAVQPSIVLLAVCMFIWLSLMPFIEATEQTIIQKVVPLERQGRVFGFAQSVEQAASPITVFLVGPIAQFIFIPFMTTGKGVELIGSWYGVGPGRGIGVVFTLAGIVGLAVTLLAMRTHSYKLLSARYQK